MSASALRDHRPGVLRGACGAASPRLVRPADEADAVLVGHGPASHLESNGELVEDALWGVQDTF